MQRITMGGLSHKHARLPHVKESAVTETGFIQQCHSLTRYSLGDLTALRRCAKHWLGKGTWQLAGREVGGCTSSRSGLCLCFNIGPTRGGETGVLTGVGDFVMHQCRSQHPHRIIMVG
jgi:hypothetical protein